MSFFDLDRLDRFSHRHDEIERSKRELKQVKEDLAYLRWQQRSADYEKERQHYREQEQRKLQRENDMEYRMNLQSHVRVILAEMEDLKLRHKFGIEEEGE